MSQNTNDQVNIYNSIDTAPDRYIVKTGSLSTKGINVIGDGSTTAFTTDFVEGDWLFDITGGQVNRIDQIYSDQLMYLIAPFDTDLPIFTTPKRVPASRTQQMGITSNGSGATVNGQTLLAGVSVNFGSDLDSNSTVNPVVINASSANVTVNKGLKG